MRLAVDFRLRHLWTTTVLTSVLLWVAPALADVEDDIEDVEQKVERLGEELLQLEARYINPRLLEYEYEVQTRLNEGLMLYLDMKYDKAAIIFLDLASNEKIQGTPARRDALYYLADSLFMTGNRIGARRHFNELLSSGAGEYYQDAVKRLIEIASLTEEFDNVENLYRAASSRASGRPKPELVYAYAKSLFFQKKLDPALGAFRRIPKDSELYPQSLYFQGVVMARQGADEAAKESDDGERDTTRLSRALKVFEQVLEVVGPKPLDPELYMLIELSHMSLGRVYYEMGQYELAIDQYQYIERTSERFDRALYEVTWTFIRRGDIEQALRHLDILLLTAPNSSLAPEARLLRGDLMLEDEQYADAVSTYQDVIDEYEPVREQLKTVLEREGGAKAYFDALVGRPVSGAMSIEVPNIVESWINEDPRMARTLEVARDLDVSSRDIEESLEIIRELEDAINSRSRIDLFPELKEGWGRGLEVQAAFISLKRQLLTLEADLVLAGATREERARYQRVRGEREEIMPIYNSIPKSRSELAQRKRRIRQDYEAQEDRLFRLSVEIDSMRAELVAIDKYMRDTMAGLTGTDKYSEKDLRQLRRDRDAFVSVIEQLESDYERLRRDVRRASAQTGINDDVAEQEEVVKKEYQAALAREREVLRSMRGRLDGRASRLVEVIEGVHSQLLRSEARLETYFGKLNRIVNRKVQDIRRLVDIEKGRVSQYTRELASYTGDSESLAGEIALGNFQRVDGRFNELILKADVGIIDVAWKRKEDRSDRIKQLFEHQSNDLKTLEQNFEGVLDVEEQ